MKVVPQGDHLSATVLVIDLFTKTLRLCTAHRARGATKIFPGNVKLFRASTENFHGLIFHSRHDSHTTDNGMNQNSREISASGLK